MLRGVLGCLLMNPARSSVNTIAGVEIILVLITRRSAANRASTKAVEP